MSREFVRSPRVAVAFGITLLSLFTIPLRAEELASASSSPKQHEDQIVRSLDGRTDYIVDLDRAAPVEYPKRLIRSTHFAAYHKPEVVNVVEDLEAAYGFEAHGMTSWSSTSFTALLNDRQLADLARDTRVARITPNRKLTFSFNALTDDGAVWNDQVTGPEVRAWGKMAVNQSSTASSGTALVYVLDAGVGQHQDLNVVEWVNAKTGFKCGTRTGAGVTACTAAQMQNVVGCYTHSTAVAGVIGAKANGSGTQGIDPGVKIISVAASESVPNAGSMCLPSGPDISTLKSGIDWVTSDIATYNAAGLTSVVNISLNWSPSDGPTTLEQDMHTLASSSPGAIIVQSAGNQYQSACSHAYAGFGSSPWTAASSSDGIMVVGAFNTHGQAVVPLTYFTTHGGAYGFWKQAAQFGFDVGSNYGACVDTWAPGDGIYMPMANPDTSANQNGTTVYSTYGFGSGTSFAAPHVAGLAAVLIESSALRTPASVESALRGVSYTLGALDAANVAMKWATRNPLPTNSPSTPYGELYLGAYHYVTANGQTRKLFSESVNGFIPGDYIQSHTGILANQAFTVSFNSRGTAPYGCTVYREQVPYGSQIGIGTPNETTYNIVGNPPTGLAPALDDWNPANDGTTFWAVGSTCFPYGTRFTN